MKPIHKTVWLGAVVLTVVAPFAHAQNTAKPFFFRDGDRAVFIGDSITQQSRYSTLIESYVLSRFPTWNISFRNTGWDGDTMGMPSRGALEGAFARDIAPLRPTAATVDYGMNDARGGDAAYESYLKNARALTGKLKDFGSRVALISPSPEEKYEAGMPAGSSYNNMLLKYSDGLQQVARETDLPYVDQIRPMIAAIEAGRRASVLGATGDPRLIPDDVHPNWAGHLVMATHILKGLNAPSLVSRVEIDARNTANIVTRAENATVTKIGMPNTLPSLDFKFERRDNALPWPIHKDTALAQTIPGFTPLQDLSRYELQISNLTAPRYAIRIDDIAVGTWTKEELAAGINLSQAPGPIHDQAQKLLQKIVEKNRLYYNRWRNVQLFRFPAWLQTPESEPARTAELVRLDAQIAALEAEINELRKPAAHIWTVAPLSTSPLAPATTVALALPAAPAALHWEKGRLVWQDAAKDETGYEIEVSQDGEKWRRLALLPADTASFDASKTMEWMISSILPPRLLFRVRAVGQNGASNFVVAHAKQAQLFN